MECGVCNKHFVRFSALRSHAKKFHSEKVDDLAPLKRSQKQYDFPCNVCPRNFSYRSNLNAHLRTRHGVNTKEAGLLKINRTKKCPLCPFENQLDHQFNDHFKNIHDIQIIMQELMFDTFDEFNLWMCTIEKETKSKFIKHRGSVVKESGSKIVYYCHRSGFFDSESKGIRRLKKQGSIKINGFCPAKIEVLSNQNGQCKIMFSETHVGHTNEDLRNLSLTKFERQSIAEKIAAKIPFPSILEGTGDSLSYDSLHRLGLLTRKDLYNIESAYNLKSVAVRHQNDAISVEASINEMCEDVHDKNNLYIESDSKLAETEDLVQSMIEVEPGTARDESVDEEVQKIRGHINKVLDNITSKEQVEALKKLIAPIEPTLSAVMQKPRSLLGTVLENHQKIPANKKILPQRHFYATKKKNKNRQAYRNLIKRLTHEHRDYK